jgi:hypothetical protein
MKLGWLVLHTVAFFVFPAFAENQCLAPVDDESKPEVVKSAQHATNVMGEALTPCSFQPRTGWFRDGSCRTDANDRGRHLVCAVMTSTFLEFTKSKGNDLSTPNPRYGFPGLKAGDRWCLCALRWKEAHEAKAAPRVVLSATHVKATQYVPLESLMERPAKEISPQIPR